MTSKSKKTTELENKMLMQIDNANIHAPEREYRFHDMRKWRFDFAWPEIMLAVEVEGGVWNQGRHTRPMGFEGDCEKYNEAAIMGWTVIRVTGKMISSGMAIKHVDKAFRLLCANLYGA